MTYSIISGYFHRPTDPWARWFFPLWLENIYRYAKPEPERIIVIASAGCEVPRKMKWSVWKKSIPLEVVSLKGDLGHADTVLKFGSSQAFPACPATWLAGAMLCYANQTDMVYLEQDCLVFGKWVDRMYKDITDHGILFGVSKMHGAATSLILLKWWFLPQFVGDYLQEGPENHENRIAEKKMHRLTGRRPEYYTQHGFGFDKDRPMNIDEPVFYGQKFTPEELRKLAAKNLISLKKMPKGVKLFSNHP
jgi:hypothetical protein